MFCRKMILIIVLLSLPTLVLAAVGDENWATTWALPGTDGEVDAIVEYDGGLVIAGAFREVGDVEAPAVAFYDGTSWSALGEGLDGEIYAAAVWNGDLYVGGDFALMDGTPGGGLARWDGSQWQAAVGGGVDYVEDMVVYDGRLVICGDFYDVGGMTAGGIAGWNGSAWDTFGGGTDSGSIYALAVDGSDLYATGEFDFIGFQYCPNVARWDGSGWSSLDGGLLDDQGEPYGAYGETIHAMGGEIAVGGGFVTAGATDAVELRDLGRLVVEHAGRFRRPFEAGPIAISDDGGAWIVSDDAGATYRWYGFYWSAIAVYTTPYTFGTYGGDLVAGGSFRNVTDVSFNQIHAANVALYDGSTWSAMATGNGIDGPVRALHAWNGMLVAGGTTLTQFGAVTGSMVAAWDGTQWVPLGGGLNANFSGYITDMVTYQGDLVVSGIFNNAGGTPVNDYARWDGTAWSPIGDGSSDGAGSMAVVDGNLYSVVYNPGSNVARLDDQTGAWQYVGDSSTSSTFYDLSVYQGNLVVSGDFSDIEGVPASGIAMWDGSSWSALGNGFVGGAFGLAELDGKLYAGGILSSAGGSPAARVAVWDGTSWSELGGGVGNRVFDLKIFDGDVFVTGEMLRLAARPSAVSRGGRHVLGCDGLGPRRPRQGARDVRRKTVRRRRLQERRRTFQRRDRLLERRVFDGGADRPARPPRHDAGRGSEPVQSRNAAVLPRA